MTTPRPGARADASPDRRVLHRAFLFHFGSLALYMYSDNAGRVFREIVEVDPDLCDGCALCMLDCHRGALVVENGKARLISDKLCASDGRCLPTCPRHALSIVRREAAPFDIKDYLEYDEAPESATEEAVERLTTGLRKVSEPTITLADQRVREQNWPIKLSQLSAIPTGADILLCADCAAAKAVDFQEHYARGRYLVTVCPKFEETGAQAARLANLFSQSRPRSLMSVRMDVDCCHPVYMIGAGALNMSGVFIKVRDVVIGLDGQEIGEGSPEPY